MGDGGEAAEAGAQCGVTVTGGKDAGAVPMRDDCGSGWENDASQQTSY